jgi:hypothetical protein
MKNEVNMEGLCGKILAHRVFEPEEALVMFLSDRVGTRIQVSQVSILVSLPHDNATCLPVLSYDPIL